MSKHNGHIIGMNGTGGQGGNTHLREDIRIVGMAVKRRWPVPDEVKERLPGILRSIAETSDSERERIAAARVIVAMEAQNQADDHVADKNARLDEGKATERIEGRILQLEFDKADGVEIT